MVKLHLANRLKEYLDENQIDIFQVESIYSFFQGVDKKMIEAVIKEVTDLDFIRIEKGKYCRKTFRNEYAIGSFLTNDAIVAYWSALNIHGLTEQFPNKVFIQTVKNKANKEVFGIEYQFIRVRKNKMVGYETHGVGSNQFRISDIEKTMVDCFDLVQYSGGFMELIRAFNRTSLNSKKMIDYSQKVGNKAAMKRMGFLAELLQKRGMKGFIDFAKKQKSKNYDLFDVYGENEGVHIAEWRLKLNMEKTEIIDIANSAY